MTEARRSLHLGKCIEDLDKLHNVPDLKTRRATMLCKTAIKLFENAEQAREKGDEEYSYVYYMKYLRVVAFLSKDKEYMKDKTYFTSMLGTKNPKKALDFAEQLKMSLIERYAKEQKAKRLNDIKESELFKQKIEENRKKAMEVVAFSETPLILPGPDEVTIKSEQLYSVLKSGKLRVMILDARPAHAYNESHINYPSCISVPEECISPGQSAHILEQSLPPASKPVWAERANMELIVLLDWNSNEVIPGNKLYLLKTILLKWDVKVHYHRQPLALRGGYEDWLLRYPALTTNPAATPPRANDLLDDMLDDIDYPDWQDTTLARPAAAPKTGEPVIDRGSKAAAVQIYEERARMQSILEQQEQLEDNSLTLEMQRIEAEQDWEKVRIKRETEDSDEIRAMYKLKEHEIASQLMQLENKQYDMEQENIRLREQLEEYQRREREEAAKLANAIVEKADDEAEHKRQQFLSEQAAAERELASKRARIAAVRLQRSQLDRTREALESQRKRKLQLRQEEDSDAYMSSPGDSPGAVGLNRSHSSPNIPKVPSEEEISVPQVDRSTKPCKVAPSHEHYQRDFQPVWGDVADGKQAELERTVAELKAELNDRDQDALLADLDIGHLPEEKGESPVHAVMVLATRLGVALQEQDVVFAKRVGAAPGAGGRRVVVRLARRQLRDDLLRAARVRRTLPAGAQRIFVNERLTRHNSQLFHKVREECRKQGWKYSWTRRGRVYARKGDGLPAFSIRTESDLLRVFGLGQPGPELVNRLENV